MPNFLRKEERTLTTGTGVASPQLIPEPIDGFDRGLREAIGIENALPESGLPVLRTAPKTIQMNL